MQYHSILLPLSLILKIVEQYKDREEVFTRKVKAGKRTYFFDIKSTRANDYYIILTESKKNPDGTYEKHKIFLYKEDFNKFVNTLNEVVDHVKTELLPDFDFDTYDRSDEPESGEGDGRWKGLNK
jgi:hypothetical protein